MERFGLSDLQAGAIVAMRLGQLSGLERQKIESELAEVQAKIMEYQAILADHAKVLDIIKTDLLNLRDKYADERRTSIEAISGEVDIEDLIPEGGMRGDPHPLWLCKADDVGYLQDSTPGRPWHFRHDPAGKRTLPKSCLSAPPTTMCCS